MKVKSFVVETSKGISDSMRCLDELVAELGRIKIHSVTDTVIPSYFRNFETGEKSREIIRVIVYTPVTDFG